MREKEAQRRRERASAEALLDALPLALLRPTKLLFEPQPPPTLHLLRRRLLRCPLGCLSFLVRWSFHSGCLGDCLAMQTQFQSAKCSSWLTRASALQKCRWPVIHHCAAAAVGLATLVAIAVRTRARASELSAEVLEILGAPKRNCYCCLDLHCSALVRMTSMIAAW